MLGDIERETQRSSRLRAAEYCYREFETCVSANLLAAVSVLYALLSNKVHAKRGDAMSDWIESPIDFASSR